MDLSLLDTSNTTAVMEVRHPVTGDPLYTEDGDLPITITLHSADSAIYENAMHDAQRAAARAAASTEGIADPERTQRQATAVLARCIESWENIVYEGADLPYTRSNANTLLTHVKFIREQISKFISNRANFLADSQGES